MGGTGSIEFAVTAVVANPSALDNSHGDAESGARDETADPQLQKVVASWPKLSVALQKAILALIEASANH